MRDIKQQQEQPGFQFGLFELNAQNRELRKNGVRLKLQDQPFEILLLMLKRAGEIVTREEIQARLWPEDTYVDFDNGINSAVRKLRDVLSDSPENPRFIETVPRRGYRFIAPVSGEVPGRLGPETSTQGETRTVAEDTRKRPWPTTVLLAIGIAGIAVVAATVLLLRKETRQPADLHVAPLTSNAGLELQPSISPDGTRVAYAWTVAPDKQPAIYVKLRGTGDPVKISKDLERVFSPVWSPDGRWIAALQDLGSIGVIILIPSSGGPIREVARVTKGDPSDDVCARSDFPFICGSSSFGSELAWSRDGKYLFTSARPPRGVQAAIVRVSIESGEVRSITSPEKDSAGDFSPAVSPNGQQLAFGRFATVRTGDLYVLPLSNNAPVPGQLPRRIATDRGDVRTPAWTADGRELVFASDQGGRRALWRVEVTGGKAASRVAEIGEDALDVAIRGESLVYNRGHYSGSLWKIPISGGKGGEPVRVTATTARDKYSQLSPDGKRITFESGRSGTDEIWVCDADGSNAVQLTSFGKGISGSPRWSPDGRLIAFDSNVDGTFHIYVVPSDGGRALQVTHGSAMDAVPSWSRDGASIYFTSSRTGRPEMWRVRAKGGSETQVTRDGGAMGVESTDAGYLYFVRGSEESGSLWRMPVNGGDTTEVLTSIEGRMFTVTPRGIYFAAGFPQAELRYLDFGNRSVSSIAPLPGMPHADVSADGRWALYPKPAMSDTNVMVVENFR